MASRHSYLWDSLLWLLGVSVPLGLWWYYAAHTADNLMPTPLGVILAAGPLLQSGELLKALWQSLEVLIGGFIAGAVPGLIIGLAIGRVRELYVAFDAYISALYAVPTIAIVPILIVAIGWGPFAKIVIIALLVALPVCINATIGVREASKDLVELSHSFCSSEWQTWRDIYWPSAMPAIIPGLRIGVGRALTGLIVAEFSTAMTGLGNVIQSHAQNFEVAASMVPVVLLIVIGFLSYSALDFLEARLHGVAGNQ